MINFITRKNYSHILPTSNIKLQDNTDELRDFLKTSEDTGYDKETNHLSPFKAAPLLSQFGNKEVQYVLDETSIPITEVKAELESSYVIGHNLKFDYKMGLMQGVRVRHMYDTMIADQVISKGSGYRYNLNDTVQRRLRIPPLNKDVREGFYRKNPNTPFTIAQIEYSADDIGSLHDLRAVQMEFISKFELYKDLYDIEFPYISILGDAELAGFYLNEDAWRVIIAENETLLIKQKNELNAILRELRDTEYPKLVALQINRTAKLQKSTELNLFEDNRVISTQQKGIMNYSSSPQVLKIWSLCGLPVPQHTVKEKGEYIEKNSMKASVLEAYLFDHPVTPLNEFIRVLIKHGETTTAISTFGERFLCEKFKRVQGKEDKLGYKLNSTGKIYTIYKQSSTETTRMSSGDQGKRMKKTDPPPSVVYYNSQNIVKLPKYRNCFLADSGCSIITIDLSQAELIIAASLSNDRTLIDLITKGDLHSSLATYSYNAIVRYITDVMPRERQFMELKDLLKADHKNLKDVTEDQEEEYTITRVEYAMKHGSFDITKATANDIRDKFKNVNYSLIYGGGVDKITELLNIPRDYAIIVEKSLHEYLPTLFSFLEANSRCGVNKGYVRFNNITGGRHWFKAYFDARKYKSPLSKAAKGEIERCCKNYPIQATQGYMLKEASVRFYYDYVYPNGFDIIPKLWIHDEHVCQVPHLYDDPKALEHAKVLQKYLNEVSTSYLVEGLKMESHFSILPYWTK